MVTGVKCQYCKSDSNKVGKDEVVKIDNKNYLFMKSKLYS